MSTYSPCGNTYVINANATAQSAYITSTQPVNSYHIVNTGSVPVHIRMSITGNTAAVFPVPGTPQRGSVVGPNWEDIVVVPSSINGEASPQPAGFNSNIFMSVIGPAGTTSANVFITPVLAF